MSVLQLYRYIVSNSNKKYSQLMLKKVENENTFTSPKPTPLVPLYQIVYEKETLAPKPVRPFQFQTVQRRQRGLTDCVALKRYANTSRDRVAISIGKINCSIKQISNEVVSISFRMTFSSNVSSRVATPTM